MLFNVESQPNNSWRGVGFRLKMLNELSEDATSSKVRMHIHALQPPNLAVTPIAPFERVHHLTDDAIIECGHEVSAMPGIAQDRSHAELDGRVIKLRGF